MWELTNYDKGRIAFNGKRTAGIIRENKSRLPPQIIHTHAHHTPTSSSITDVEKNPQIYKKMTYFITYIL